MKKILFEITSPERVLFKDEIDSFTCETRDGEITVLPGHISLIAPLKAGGLVIRKDGEETTLAVAGGFLQVDEATSDLRERIANHVVVLADAAERIEEIDAERAKTAQERAKQAMEEYRGKDLVKYAEAAGAFERALGRLKIAQRKRSRARARNSES